MATRSLIGIVNQDGSIETIYNHWDGYPTYVGTILTLFYDEEATRELLALGNRSVLNPKPTAEETYKARGDAGQEKQKYASFAEFQESDKSGAEFVYLLERIKTDEVLIEGWVGYSVNWEDDGLTRLGLLQRDMKYEYPSVAVGG